MAIKSKFGWLLSGPVRNKNEVVVESQCNLIIEQSSSDATVQEEDECKIVEELKKYWETEAIGIVERQDTEKNYFQNK